MAKRMSRLDRVQYRVSRELMAWVRRAFPDGRAVHVFSAAKDGLESLVIAGLTAVVFRRLRPLELWLAAVSQNSRSKVLKLMHGAVLELYCELGLFTLGLAERRLNRFLARHGFHR